MHRETLSSVSKGIFDEMMNYHASRLQAFDREQEARQRLRERDGKSPRLDLFRLISRLASRSEIHGDDREVLDECGRALKIQQDYLRPTVPAAWIFGSGQRDLTAASASAGGYLVSPATALDVAQSLKPRSIVAAFGATILPNLVGNSMVPIVTAGPAITWQTNEATTITEANPTIGQVALSPKTVATRVDLSRQLVKQSNAGDVVKQELAIALGAAMDAAAINGSGANGQPTGLIGTANVNAVTGTSLAWGGVLDFMVNAGAANADVTGFAMPPAIYKLLANRERFTGGGFSIVHDGLIDGRAARHSTSVPSATLVGGPWPDIVIPLWGGIDILVDPYSQFQTGIVTVRAAMTMDVGVRHPAAFSKATSIT